MVYEHAAEECHGEAENHSHREVEDVGVVTVVDLGIGDHAVDGARPGYGDEPDQDSAPYADITVLRCSAAR